MYISANHRHFLSSVFTLCYDNAVLKIWPGLGMKHIWLVAKLNNLMFNFATQPHVPAHHAL